MLKSIHIENLVIIKSIDIKWTEGLNVLTGETGAGKSILFDALSIVLGAKANASYIRHGSERAYIEATIQPGEATRKWLVEQELTDSEQPDLVISRELTKSGSRARINGILVNHSVLKDLSNLLITFHAQHEIRTLMNNSTQLGLLDGIAEKKHQELLNSFRAAYQNFKELESTLTGMQISEDERERRLDFARFQFNELDEASLDSTTEEDELIETRNLLSNVKEIEESIQESVDNLSGSFDDGGSESVLEKLQSTLSLVDSLVSFDSGLEGVRELVQTSLATAEEACQQLRRYGDGIDADPETLERVEERLAILASIKRKYGPELKNAIELRDGLAREIEQLENATEELSALEKKLAEAKEKTLTLAAELTRKRTSLAKSLEASIMLELKDLGMEKAVFKIEFEKLDSPGPTGLDRVEFTISTNVGTPPKPLSKIASGGELSRIMLALKTIFARQDQVATVVFDEIDAGMSGKTLHAIREKLARLARSHQILSITHNPIIASVADNHIQVCKEQSKKETIIRVSNLNESERLNSLAQMASGEADQQESLNFARSLVDAAGQLKSTIK
ncbi:MAG TPA: DNA repair protein RecN [Candidatus Melainabacteria bacterium]|nr:DNA repair protein RecN [Candidatus Melainabacteria bacterium]